MGVVGSIFLLPDGFQTNYNGILSDSIQTGPFEIFGSVLEKSLEIAWDGLKIVNSIIFDGFLTF